ncbi:hypothetical protein ABT282_07075 [Streptomyces sp. NPDC000927]|uniref:hypothetical protein n=1 Tax=Streptomyces sp. NPDC000927 TaxID=3154371 RepID=UPI003329D688
MSKYSDDLHEAMGLINAYDIGCHFECPVIYFNTMHPHAFGTRDHRAEVTFLRDGQWWKSKSIRVRGGHSSLKEIREVHLNAAVEWAERKGLGVEEWVPSGFPNTWIPKPVKDQIQDELKSWRKKQKANLKEIS